MPSPPTGTVTFLFTDIQGSTALWETHGDEMGISLARHDGILREAIESRTGYVFKTVGDSFCSAFQSAADALSAALGAQRELASAEWGATGPLKVRMGLHTGSAAVRDNDYFGPTLNRVSRISSAAHGGQLVVSLTTFELLRDEMPGGVGTIDLGSHRLRGLARAERIFQILADGLERDFPPLRSLDALPNNLPVPVTSFIGRERETEAVKASLAQVRLLTLMGPGGTGKTRLAIEVAMGLVEKFADGAWLVELATLSGPERVVESVASSVGAREEADIPLVDSLSHFLKDKKLLLVLDNCEHLLQAVGDLVTRLLRSCPGLKVLSTSRHSLGVSGETTWPVPPLQTLQITRDSLGEPDLLEQMASYESVRLFVDRAVAVRPDFVLNRDNAEAVARICYRLDGIPLAIELAAARVKMLTPAQIAERLNDRFRLLRGGDRTGLPHQQTLQALIDWSHDLLSTHERTLFRRLAVFVGGRTFEAVERVCSGDGLEVSVILDLLEQLVDKSLVSMEQAAPGVPRYTMTESIWQYACDRLGESGEEIALRARHLDYFLELAEIAEPQLYGADQVEWIERIQLDYYNFRAAVAWVAEGNASAEKGLRLASALGRFWEVRGNLESAISITKTLLARADPSEFPLAYARATEVAGRLAWCQDNNVEARRLFTRARELYGQVGEMVRAEFTSAFLGFIDRGEQDIDSAEKRFRHAIEYGRKNGYQKLLAIGLSGLGSVELDRGMIDESRKLKEESLALYRAEGDLWIIGLILWGFARTAISQGDGARARAAIEEWTGIARSLGNRWVLPYVLESFAELQVAEGEAAIAARLLGAAEVLREKLGLQFAPAERADYDRLIGGIRSQIPPERFDEAWRGGRLSAPWDLIHQTIKGSRRVAG